MNVIGLNIEDRQAHWNTLIALKDSIKYMTQNNVDGVYNHHIQNNLETFGEFLKEFSSKSEKSA